MKPNENDSGAFAGMRSRGASSPERRDASRGPAPVASRTLAERLRALRGSVWAPVLAKALAVGAGMLALAAIGASSLARGSGVPYAAAAPHAAGNGGPAVASFAGPAPSRTSGPSERAASATLTLAARADAADTADAGVAPSGETQRKIALNSASADELRHLPGVGPKRADAIVALRAKLGGRFKRVSDLLRVKGIGPKGLKKIEPLVVLDPPPAA